MLHGGLLGTAAIDLCMNAWPRGVTLLEGVALLRVCVRALLEEVYHYARGPRGLTRLGCAYKCSMQSPAS